jgi:hypothetical protein
MFPADQMRIVHHLERIITVSRVWTMLQML